MTAQRDRVAVSSMAIVIACVVAAVLAYGPVAARADTSVSTFDRIDALVEAEMSDLHIPGLALAIVQGDQIVHLRGFGREPSGAAITPQTPFVLASVSKSITALAVMQLVEDGKLDLDAPVQRYLPSLGLPDGITARRLLYHTSGIGAGVDMFGTEDGPAALEEHVRRIASAPVGAPGHFEYSDANYDVLGLLVQRLAGEPFARYLADRIFTPLAMPHSSAAGEQGGDGGASGYYRWFGLLPYPARSPYGDGSVPSALVRASAEDLSHLLMAHLNGGLYDGRRVLSEAGMATLHTAGVSTSDVDGYAMGWYVSPIWGATARDGSSYRVPLLLHHTGAAPTFHADVDLLPEQRLGIAILMNTNDRLVSSRFDRLAYSLPLMMLDRAPTPAVAYEDVLMQHGRSLLALAALAIAAVGFAWVRRARSATARRTRSLAVMALALGVCGVWLLAISRLSGEMLVVALRLLPDVEVLLAATLALPLAAILAALALALHAGREGRRSSG